jgi:hypothetical protein
MATALNDNDTLFSERNCNNIKAATDSCLEAKSHFNIALKAKEGSLSLSDKLRILSAWSFVQPRCEVSGVLLIASKHCSLRLEQPAVQAIEKHCPAVFGNLEAMRTESEKQQPMVNFPKFD